MSVTDSATLMQAPRTAWGTFPDVYILADEMEVRGHDAYSAAKGQADYLAGLTLFNQFLTDDKLRHLQRMIPKDAILAAAHAVERHSVNIIPATYAAMLQAFLGREFEPSIVQTNVAGHTKASGWKRLASPAQFTGKVKHGHRYFLIDDFIGMGGTLANLKGYIESRGGIVVGASVLTGKASSAIMTPDDALIGKLDGKYDEDFKTWWHTLFGFGFGLLTQSEAGYLYRQTKSADIIRNKILAEMR